MDSFLYVTTDESEIEKIFGSFFDEYDIHPEYFALNMQEGAQVKKRIGFNPMLTIKFDNSVPMKIIDAVGAKLKKERQFAHLEKGRFSIPYTSKLIPRRKVYEFPGPGLWRY